MIGWWLAVALAAAQETPASPSGEPASAVSDTEWAIATSRALGAAGTVRERAWQLRRTTSATLEDGRIGRLNALQADAKGLEQAVVSATLAVEVLAEKVAPATAPTRPPAD
ncbi:MAG: hypothetical protein H6742_17945 [Alphaproteobacteria bacterium]|nr:hypothetical protein [Alphaproteobacteria bacterium]